MGTLSLELPRELVAGLGADDSERVRVMRLELALALYASGKLPPGQAAALSGLARSEFSQTAKARKVFTPYTREMIEEDFAHARGGK